MTLWWKSMFVHTVVVVRLCITCGCKRQRSKILIGSVSFAFILVSGALYSFRDWLQMSSSMKIKITLIKIHDHLSRISILNIESTFLFTDMIYQVLLFFYISVTCNISSDFVLFNNIKMVEKLPWRILFNSDANGKEYHLTSEVWVVEAQAELRNGKDVVKTCFQSLCVPPQQILWLEELLHVMLCRLLGY